MRRYKQTKFPQMKVVHKLFKGFPLTCICSAQRIDCAHGAPAYKENRKKICEVIGIDYRSLVFPEQPHGAKISTVGGKDRGVFITGCDGLITQEKNLPLAVLTADCLPVFIYHPKNKSIGIGHAGWQGTRIGIARELVQRMEKEFGCIASHLHVGFGPSIRACCYEVEEKFLMYFPHSVVTRDKKYYLDLPGENKRQLAECGVETSKIFDSEMCTSCSNDTFFSHRKERGKAGRTISIIEMKG